MCPCPAPQSQIESKYVYFYNPYTYEINTQKFIKFNQQDVNEDDFRRTAEESGWSKVKSFLKEKDEKLYFFAIN